MQRSKAGDEGDLFVTTGSIVKVKIRQAANLERGGKAAADPCGAVKINLTNGSNELYCMRDVFRRNFPLPYRRPAIARGGGRMGGARMVR